MKNIRYIIIVFTMLSSCTYTNERSTPNKTSKIGYESSKLYLVQQYKLYNAFTDPEVLKRIWGVQDITVDARVGGETNAIYKEGGKDWSFTLTYIDVIPNEKLHWVTHFNNYPNKEPEVTLLFKKVPNGTELVIRMNNFESIEERDANKKIWEAGLKTLSEMMH